MPGQQPRSATSSLDRFWRQSLLRLFTEIRLCADEHGMPAAALKYRVDIDTVQALCETHPNDLSVAVAEIAAQVPHAPPWPDGLRRKVIAALTGASDALASYNALTTLAEALKPHFTEDPAQTGSRQKKKGG